MEIFILIFLGVVIVLLITSIGRRLGRTMPRRDAMQPWKDDKISTWNHDLDNDPHVIGSAARSIRRLFRDD